MKNLHFVFMALLIGCGQGPFIEKKDNESSSGASFQAAEVSSSEDETLILETNEKNLEISEEEINNFIEGGINHPCLESLSEPGKCRIRVRGIAKSLKHIKGAATEVDIKQLYSQGFCIPLLSEVFTVFTVEKVNFQLSVSIELEINGV